MRPYLSFISTPNLMSPPPPSPPWNGSNLIADADPRVANPSPRSAPFPHPLRRQILPPPPLLPPRQLPPPLAPLREGGGAACRGGPRGRGFRRWRGGRGPWVAQARGCDSWHHCSQIGSGLAPFHPRILLLGPASAAAGVRHRRAGREARESDDGGGGALPHDCPWMAFYGLLRGRCNSSSSCGKELRE